jgi:hypothetical protein
MTQSRATRTRRLFWGCRRGCCSWPVSPAGRWPSLARRSFCRCCRRSRRARSRAEGRAARLPRAGIAPMDWGRTGAMVPKAMPGCFAEKTGRGTERSAAPRRTQWPGLPGSVTRARGRDRNAPEADWRRQGWVAGLPAAIRRSASVAARARCCCRDRSSRWVRAARRRSSRRVPLSGANPPTDDRRRIYSVCSRSSSQRLSMRLRRVVMARMRSS